MIRVLVVDDDRPLARALAINLKAHGYDVTVAHDGRTALTEVSRAHPAVVVLDLGLPDIDGIEVLAGIRGWSATPVIVLSARSTSAEKVEALDAGADDYVTKPFQIDELLARLRALSRRRGAASGTPVVSFGDVVVDLSTKTVTRGGERVHLTPTEWRILEFLARNPGSLVTRQALLKDIWGTEQVADTGYLRLYISQLRKKLEADPGHPAHLLTESGMGYRLLTDAS